MKTQISAIEISVIVKELQSLAGAKIDKIYQPVRNKVILQLYKSGSGKKMLCIDVPGFLYLTRFKGESPAKILGFCATLRKYLSGARVESISQKDSERIVQILFDAKEDKYILICELFSKGNIILCKEDMTIITPLYKQEWKARTIAAKQKYIYPPEGINLFSITRQSFREGLEEEKELVKKLATNIGLGGTYAEEVVLRSGLDKQSEKQNSKDIDKLMSALKDILSAKTKGYMISDAKKIIDILPHKLDIHKGKEFKEFKTFNEALDEYLTTALKKDISESKHGAQNKQIEKTKAILEQQEKNLKKLKKDAEDNQRKGELIYEHYPTVKDVLESLKIAREKYSWDEIKEKLKGHKLITSINPKEKKVVIDIKD